MTGLRTIAKEYGGRILEKPFPEGVSLYAGLKAEMDAAEKIVMRMAGVGPGFVSYNIELKYILSHPEIENKTLLFGR
jgi:hypothetical protein